MEPPHNARVVLNEGGGRPPGYSWTVICLNAARAEAEKLYTEDQYDHLVEKFKFMALEAEPLRCPLLNIDDIEDFYELKDKGGVLQNINARVFFYIHPEARTIVILGTINKKNDGPTRVGPRVRMRERLQAYLMHYTRVTTPRIE